MISHLLVKNMDFPGADEMARILRKMLPDDLKTPDELAEDLPPGVTMGDDGVPIGEDGQPWQKPLTPQEQLAQEALEVQREENQAKIAKAQADTADAQAKLQEAQVALRMLEQGLNPQGGINLDQLREDINGDMQQQLGAVQSDMNQSVQQIVTEAMTAHQEDESAHKAMDVEGQITDAVVEALRRVRKVYDQKLGEVSEVVNGVTPQNGENGGVSVFAGDIEFPKVRAINFETDGETITRAVPEYEESTGTDDE